MAEESRVMAAGVAIVILFMAGLLVMIFSTEITEDLKDDFLTTENVHIDNETITVINATGVSLAHDRIVPASEDLRSENNTQMIRGGDYFIANVTGIITLANTSIYDGNVSNITYDFTRDVQDAPTNASINALQGQTNISSKAGTIATVVIAVIVLGLLVAGFGMFLRTRTA